MDTPDKPTADIATFLYTYLTRNVPITADKGVLKLYREQFPKAAKVHETNLMTLDMLFTLSGKLANDHPLHAHVLALKQQMASLCATLADDGNPDLKLLTTALQKSITPEHDFGDAIHVAHELIDKGKHAAQKLREDPAKLNDVLFGVRSIMEHHSLRAQAEMPKVGPRQH